MFREGGCYNAEMAKKQRPRRSEPVSLAPLTPEQALAGLLKVKHADVKKLEAEEAGKKKEIRRG